MGSSDTSIVTDWGNWLQHQSNRMIVLMVMAGLAMLIPLVANT